MRLEKFRKLLFDERFDKYFKCFTRDELFIQTMILKVNSFEICAQRIELGMKGGKDREIYRYENLKWKIEGK